jgi:transcription elongation factor Elf1
MSDALNRQQFDPDYVPDPKPAVSYGTTTFTCQGCGSRYITPTAVDRSITQLANCRNRGCSGPVVRSAG